MMQANYIVQNPHMTQGSTQAVVDGELTAVIVNVFEVQLVAEDTSDGSIMLRFKGSDIAPAQDLFTPDSQVVAQFVKMSDLAAQK